jgi:beta-lactamase regulating signal transducer with metallopeptidase domain
MSDITIVPVFTLILNMSVTASIIALMVFLARVLVNKKLPRSFSYALWAIVLIRLLLPFYFSSPVSLLNLLPTPEPTSFVQGSSLPEVPLGSIKYIPDRIGMMKKPEVDTGSQAINKAINSSLPAATPYASINPMQFLMFAGAWIWLITAASFLLFSIFSYLQTVRQFETAILFTSSPGTGLSADIFEKAGLEGLRKKIRIYTSDRATTPVVCGLLKPRIILPSFLAKESNESALQHIILHELIHIKRKDHIIKPLSVLALCLHWFNPVIWMSFILFQKDMETSCDEKVISASGSDIRSGYASSLINLAARQNLLLNGGLLAFGESSIKSRVKSIMSYRKPGFWLITAGIAVFVILGAALLTNPGSKTLSNSNNSSGSNSGSNSGNGQSTTKAEAVNPPSENGKNGFQLYLVDEKSASDVTDDTPVNELALEAQPLLSGPDIISYNWDTQCLKIKNEGKLSRDLLKRRFVVTADGERIYSGAFWSALYSMWPPKITIYLDKLFESGTTVILPLVSWQPGEEIPADVQKTLADRRIRQVLERDGKLYKAYIPIHFDRPDYINICEKGTQYNYGGFDWEKKDALLQLLDKRFSGNLDYVKPVLSSEEDAAMHQNDMLVLLGYNEQRKLKYKIGASEESFTCRELVMPLTGNYSDLLLFRDDNGYIGSPVGRLAKLSEKDLPESEAAVREQSGSSEPDGMNLVYYKGGAFQSVLYSAYELDSSDTATVLDQASSGKVLKSKPAGNPQILPLTLRFGKNDDRWFHVLDDGKSLFSEGKYYSNPSLAGTILKIAKEKCGVTIFEPTSIKDIISAKYSFRTKTRTIERTLEAPETLSKIEKGLQQAVHNMGGGCPFSDGVLSLSFSNGTAMEISMASDDCPLMFINGTFLQYSNELHKLLEASFDNFPYVRE